MCVLVMIIGRSHHSGLHCHSSQNGRQNNYDLHHGCALCAEIASQLALGEQTFVKGVEGAFSSKRMHCGRCEWQCGSNSLTRKELYQMTFMEVHGTDSTKFVHSHMGGDSIELWHCRLGHLDVRSVNTLQNMVKGINVDNTSPSITTLVCEACTECKHYTTKWGNNTKRLPTKPLEIVHSGVCGLKRTTSVGKAKYFVTFIDNFLKKT